MTYCVFTFLLVYILIIVSLNLAVALNVEGIIGGQPAAEHIFKYQVAVVAQHNFSSSTILACSGVIIHAYFILSAAHCFLFERYIIKPVSFSIIVDSVDLESTFRYKIKILEIYVQGGSPIFTNDLAVVKLNESLDLSHYYFLQKLSLPDPDESFENSIGLVSGYGFNWIKTGKSSFTGKEIRICGGTSNKLRFVYVKISNSIQCRTSYPGVLLSKQMCGMVLTDHRKQKWGLCSKDAGSPLVIGNKVVGIASYNYADCNDTEKGSIYTKISFFTNFIISILKGYPTNGTLIYHNLPHVLANA